ncbi:hypothetical protein F5Y16DRAFT_376329 [Xylariaceae sp. FL0255]|nr:hypothetical protein F5Y16DRAFT_376329 [Xylariaceae sp. FL0255]
MATEQAKVKLHWLERSRAQNILWLLEELKIPYDLATYHRRADELAPDDLKKVHPLGKSPLVTITPVGASEPLVLAESGFITQYLCEHFGGDTTMMPKKWKDGQEGKVGGETEAWLRWQYLLHFIEGSFLSSLFVGMILGMLKGPKVPFFIRPITSLVINQVFAQFVFPNAKGLYSFLEQQLETSGGDFLCGKDLTAADILISFSLITAKDKIGEFGTYPKGTPAATYPKVWAYIDRLETQPGYQKSVQKIKEIDSTFGIKF